MVFSMGEIYRDRERWRDNKLQIEIKGDMAVETQKCKDLKVQERGDGERWMDRERNICLDVEGGEAYIDRDEYRMRGWK